MRRVVILTMILALAVAGASVSAQENAADEPAKERHFKGKYHHKDVAVRGSLYANANMLDVTSFNVDGEDKSWCGHCKAMDGCAAKISE